MIVCDWALGGPPAPPAGTLRLVGGRAPRRTRRRTRRSTARIMLGSVEVEAPFELEVPMFLSKRRAVRQKKVFRRLPKFVKNETERGVPCRFEKPRSVLSRVDLTFENPRSVPFRSQVNKLFTCRSIAHKTRPHALRLIARARAAGGQRRRSQVQRVLHTALPLAPLSLLSRSAPSAFDERTRSPRRTSAAPLASRCCPRLTRRARAPCAHTC